MVDFLKEYLSSFQTVKHAVDISVTPDSARQNVHQGYIKLCCRFSSFKKRRVQSTIQNVSESGHLELFGVRQSLKRQTDALQQ